MRVKRGSANRNKHKTVYKLTKGFRGSLKKIFRAANQAMMKALRSSYANRRKKKRDFRRLWIVRINAAARINGMSYSQMICGLKRADIKVNRKILADLAVNDAPAFAQLATAAKEKLSA
ncbi:MAG TPA: 50S ribosomal protein L20 [Chroococcales cyanobacterium]